MADDTPVYVGTISFEFVSADDESAGRELDEHAQRIAQSLGTRRVEAKGPVRMLGADHDNEETSVGT